MLGNGAYKLETLEGELFLEHGTWQTSSFTIVKMFCFIASFLNNLMFKVMLFFPLRGFLIRSSNDKFFLKDGALVKLIYLS